MLLTLASREDGPDIETALARPGVYQPYFLAVGAPSAAVVREMWAAGGPRVWVARAPDDGSLFGATRLERGVLSFFVDERCWGRGVGTEMVRRTLQLIGPGDRIVAEVARENARSRRLLERLAFTFAGIRTRPLLGGHGRCSLLRYTAELSGTAGRCRPLEPAEDCG